MQGKRQKISQRKLRAVLLMAAAGGLSLAIPHHVSADSDSWIGTSGGNWTDGTQWTAGVPPTSLQGVYITNAFSGSQTITYDFTGATLDLNTFFLDATGGGTNVLSMQANILNGNYEDIANNGCGVFNQSGGQNIMGNLYVGGYSGAVGTYNLSGGSLSGNPVAYIGFSAQGYFNQTGNGSSAGFVDLLLGFSPGGTGNYGLSGGTLNAGIEYVGFNGTGNFDQTSTNSFNTGSLFVGANVGSTGHFTFSAGMITAPEEHIGDEGTGYFNQSGGTNTIYNQPLILGRASSATGTYTLSGGVLKGGLTQYVGYSGIGDFQQSGGTNSVSGTGAIYIAFSSGAVGTYTITGGFLSDGAGVYVGGNTNAPGGVGSLTVGGTGELTINGNLKIWNSGTVTLNGGASSATAGALQIAPGGNLVMNGPHNAFILNYGTAASPNTSIRQYLQNGYNGGFWDAGGTLPNPTVGAITSATAVASNGFSLGYADGSDGVVAGLSSGQEEIKFTYAGDANLDGQVNLTDLVMLANHFGSTGANWDQGDFSYDGSVNLTDLTILASHFGDGVGNPLQDAQVHAQFTQDLEILESSDPAFATEVSRLVPEPSSIALISIAGIGLLKRRSRIPAKKKD